MLKEKAYDLSNMKVTTKKLIPLLNLKGVNLFVIHIPYDFVIYDFMIY